jgi:hypothetical protein
MKIFDDYANSMRGMYNGRFNGVTIQQGCFESWGIAPSF